MNLSKFIDLDLDRKTQLILNMRVQSMMAQFIAHHNGVEVQAILDVFFDRAYEVFTLSEDEINKHLEVVDNQLDYCVKNEAKAIIRVDMKST